jgi:hypothetical protein
MADVPEGDPAVLEAVGILAAEDPAAASTAAAALGWLTAGGGTARLTQERLQRFLWYDLPLKWSAEPPARRTVASALARVLDLLQLPRYAELCRSEATSNVFAAYEESPEKGLAAYRQANLDSGIYPLDLPEIKWGAIMGVEEAKALSSVQEFLELAIAAGDLVPGARGWKARQAKLVRSFLNAPNFQLGGQTPLSVTLTERIQMWLRIEPSETRHRLLSALANRLLHPIELPEGVTDPFPPLTLLLRQLAGGTPTADDLGEYDVLRQMAKQLGLARRRGGQLLITARGKDLLENPESSWRMVPAGLLSGNALSRLAGEVLLALLVDAETVPYSQVVETAGRSAEEANYRDVATGLPPGEPTINRALHETIHPCRALGMLSSDGDEGSKIGLTAAGKATALEALRARATGPGSAPWI